MVSNSMNSMGNWCGTEKACREAKLPPSRQVVAIADGVGAVLLDFTSKEIKSTKRKGNDLAVRLSRGDEVVLAGFFATEGTVLLARGKGLWDVDEIEIGPRGGFRGAALVMPGRLDGMSGPEALRIVSLTSRAKGARRRDRTAFAMPGVLEGDGAGVPAPTLIGGLLLLGVAVAACGGGGGGSQPTTSAPVDPDLSDDAEIAVNAIEAALGGGDIPVRQASY